MPPCHHHQTRIGHYFALFAIAVVVVFASCLPVTRQPLSEPLRRPSHKQPRPSDDPFGTRTFPFLRPRLPSRSPRSTLGSPLAHFPARWAACPRPSRPAAMRRAGTTRSARTLSTSSSTTTPASFVARSRSFYSVSQSAGGDGGGARGVTVWRLSGTETRRRNELGRRCGTARGALTVLLHCVHRLGRVGQEHDRQADRKSVV